MKHTYTHLAQGEDIGFDERSYRATEMLLEYRDRKVLYLYVEASAVTFCDRSYAPHMVSINVKGYVSKWKCGASDTGDALSEIEPVEDEVDRRQIAGLLRAAHSVADVNFF